MAPKVSIIIPAYKVEKYLRQCLDSLINQTLKDIEIIVVDEGDMDECRKIIDEYEAKDNRIVAIHEHNGGYSISMNKGLSRATGEYVCFVDGDDYIANNMYETLINKAKETDADIVSCSLYEVYTKNNRIINVGKSNELYSKLNKVVSVEDYPELLIEDAFTWNRLYKMDYIKKNSIKFQDGIDFCGDTVFYRRALLSSGSVVHIPDKLYYYVQRTGASTSGTNKLSFNCLTIISMLWDSVKQREKLIPSLNHVILSFGAYGYEKTIPSRRKEYFREYVKFLQSLPKPFKISYPNCDNVSFMTKARYISLKFLHPIQYFALIKNQYWLFKLNVLIRIILQKSADFLAILKS